MIINEMVKSFLTQPETLRQKVQTHSSVVSPEKIINSLDQGEGLLNTGSFFDDYSSAFGDLSQSDILIQQRNKITTYRQIAKQPEVSDALEEIINEIVFNHDFQDMLIINIESENKKINTALVDKFKKIKRLMNFDQKAFQIIRQGYVDGQYVFHISYDKDNTKNGIKSISMIEPSMLMYDERDNTYKYYTDAHGLASNKALTTYSYEEIVKIDFGLREGLIILSYLEQVIKPANMLRTLEDLLVPLRFSRSISRRVFNVDVGDLPRARAEEVMKEYQAKFKYKKFYNNETGEVTNQQHITSMVEDYWFSNRSGGKGTSVDTIDETGNLGELGDILYFYKKLYKAMKIPLSRISLDPDADRGWDYQSTTASKDDMRFFMHITRVRSVITELLKKILKTEVISSGIMSEKEWASIEESITIAFSSESLFIEQLRLDIFKQKMEIYQSMQEYQGKIFSVKETLKRIFKFSEEEIEEFMAEIEKERKNPLYKNFYTLPDEGGQW